MPLMSLRLSKVVQAAAVVVVLSPLPARSQTTAGQPAAGEPAPLPPAALAPGDRVWVTSPTGEQQQARVAAVNPTSIRLSSLAGQRDVNWPDVALLEAEVSDSLANGTRNGALTGGLGMAGFSGFVLALVCSIEGCDAGDAARFTLMYSGLGAATGAAIGALLDAGQPTRRALYPGSLGIRLGDVAPGEHIWIGTRDGRQVQGQILAASPAAIDVVTEGRRMSVPLSDVAAVRAERSDPLGNGVRNGLLAGAATMAGLLVAGQATGGDCCEPGLTLYWTGVGAGAGALAGLGIDALVKSRTPVYAGTGTATATRVTVAPVIGRESRGVQVSLRW